jgi:hypothetical protein
MLDFVTLKPEILKNDRFLSLAEKLSISNVLPRQLLFIGIESWSSDKTQNFSVISSSMFLKQQPWVING